MGKDAFEDGFDEYNGKPAQRNHRKTEDAPKGNLAVKSVKDIEDLSDEEFAEMRKDIEKYIRSVADSDVE